MLTIISVVITLLIIFLVIVILITLLYTRQKLCFKGEINLASPALGRSHLDFEPLSFYLMSNCFQKESF